MKATFFSAISAGRGETLEKFATDCAEYGFQGLEIAAIRPHLSPLIYKTRADRKKVLEFVRSKGLEFSDIDMRSDLINPYPHNRERELVVFEVLAKMAVDVECPIVKVDHGSGWRYPETGMQRAHPGYTWQQQREWLVESLKECAKIAEEYGIMCGLHNHEFCTARENLRIINEVNSDHLGLIIDADNATKFHENVPETVRMAGKDKILLCHIKDHVRVVDYVYYSYSGVLGGNIPIERPRMCKVGEGVVDNEGFVKALKEAGWDGYLSLEAVGREMIMHGLKWIQDHI